jgi:hypothetical protein
MSQVIETVGAGEGNRTLVISLEGFCSTIELHPQNGRALIRPADIGARTAAAHTKRRRGKRNRRPRQPRRRMPAFLRAA